MRKYKKIKEKQKINPNSTLTEDTVHMLAYSFFLFSYWHHSYIWCQLPENLQESPKQTMLLWADLMELRSCVFKKACSWIQDLPTGQSWASHYEYTPAHRGCCQLFPPAPVALQRGICSAFSYPDPFTSQSWGAGCRSAQLLGIKRLVAVVGITSMV